MKHLLPLTLLAFSLIGVVPSTDAQIIINEVLIAENILELKNIGNTTINLQNTRILSGGDGMTITTATVFSCGSIEIPPATTVGVPIPYPTVATQGEFIVYLNATDPAAYIQWGGVQSWATTAFSQGLWDDPSDFLSGLPSGFSIELVVVDERKNSGGWLSQGDPTLCEENTQCAFSDVSVENILCNDNGTPSDPSDDYFTFTLDISGINLDDNVNLTIPGGTLAPSTIATDCNTCQISGPIGSANGDEYTLTIVTENGECEINTKIEAPFSCSPECELSLSQFIFLDCFDNGTSEDPTDDYIEFIVRPFGNNLDDEYYVEFSFGNTIGPLQNSAPFTVISSEGFYVPGSGDFSITIIDGGDNGCTETMMIPNQESCSPNCFMSFDSLGVRCDDGGTPYDDADDFYTVDVQVNTTASASDQFQFSLDPFIVGNEMLDYGMLHSYSSAPGSTAAINGFALSVIDPDYPSCIGLTLNGSLDEGCLEECEIFSADIALEEAPIICLEPDDASIFTFEIINGIVMDTFLLLALDENDEIVFFTDKLSFDAREFDAGIYRFVVVNFLALDGVELEAGIDRLEGCFALSPEVEVELLFQENCTTAVVNENNENSLIYPNPTVEKLFIKSDYDNLSVVVMSLSGKILLQSTGSKCLNIEVLPKGCYIVGIFENGNLKGQWQKMIKI